MLKAGNISNISSSNLSHYCYEGSLADVAGFAAHIGSSNDQGAGAPAGQVGVIGHDRAVQGNIQHWVAALDNPQLGWFISVNKCWPSVPGCDTTSVKQCMDCCGR